MPTPDDLNYALVAADAYAASTAVISVNIELPFPRDWQLFDIEITGAPQADVLPGTNSHDMIRELASAIAAGARNPFCEVST